MNDYATRDESYFEQVALGKIPGRKMMYAMGERESMSVIASGEDIWRGNELSPAPTDDAVIPIPAASGEQMTVVSESANDAAVGTGIQQIEIEYLDANGDEQEEIITLNGTTPVNTVATDIRFVNDMYAVAIGTGGVAAGNIKIYKTGTVGDVYNMIYIGGNKSLVPSRMVPAGKVLYLDGWHAEEAQDKRVAIKIRSTDMHGVIRSGIFCFKDTVYMRKTSSGFLPLNYAIPAFSIVKVSGWSDQASAEASCSWRGVLIDN